MSAMPAIAKEKHVNPPVIVFDLDGTLIDTAPDLAASLNHVLALHDMPTVDLASFRNAVGRGARHMLERAIAQAGESSDRFDLDAMTDAFVAHYADGMPGQSQPFDGLLDSMARFEAAGWRLAVCTNKREALSLKLLDDLGLIDRFVAICGADTFDFRKPDPRHLTETIARAAGNAGRSIMVGDSATDIDTARAARIPVVAVDFGYSETPVTELGPDIVISSYDALDPELAERLLSRRGDW